MKDEVKTRYELIAELAAARQQIAGLDASIPVRKAFTAKTQRSQRE